MQFSSSLLLTLAKAMASAERAEVRAARLKSGWNPDLNDGVRMNIRPFMTAGVLRHNKKPKLNIGWDKDRGKDVESAPWFGVFKGEPINDHHLTLAEKTAARGASS
jgi:hypothetical protein